ncbi:MAG: twin-arginine translocase TatA/TatE family subunit [Fibromonadaceae bacterium]|jgi:sec-independent protein translocase protein TatA|nr:twin-arginine translocase TatA/TatE family subunit [Fibromonadaceae bacterium]
MGFIGVNQLLLILLIVLVLFGAKKIPELAKGLALGLREFRKASKELKDELDDDNVKTASTKESSQIDDKNS